MSAADSLNANQDEMIAEVARHELEMSRLIGDHDGLIGEVMEELTQAKEAAHSEGYDAGVEAEKEPNR